MTQPSKRRVWVKTIFITCFLLLVSLFPVWDKVSKSVEAPTTRLADLGQQVHWSEEDIKEAIDILCEVYDFPYPTLLNNLAQTESKYGQDTRCGDNGKSCGLYQIRVSTWQFFVQITGRTDLDYKNQIDQTEMTILALQKGYWYFWGPLTRQYRSNPIK